MKQFEQFLAWYRALITAIISLTCPLVYNYISSFPYFDGAIWNLAITVFSSVLFAELMNVFAEFLISHFVIIRKLILGNLFFEGTGVDFTYDTTKKEVLYGAITRYYYSNYQLCGEAEVFDEKGEVTGTFKLKTFECEGNAIKYGFTGVTRLDESKNSKYCGYGEMNFGSRDGSPHNYFGFYIDNCDYAQLFFEGNLINKKEIKKMNADSQYRRTFLAKAFNDFAERKRYLVRINKSNIDL